MRGRGPFRMNQVASEAMRQRAPAIEQKHGSTPDPSVYFKRRRVAPCEVKIHCRCRPSAFLVPLALAGLLSGCGPVDESQRSSILLVVIDTTRADAVSAYGVNAHTTPVLDELAASGIRYDRAYAQAPWTLPSHASLFTGLLPSEHHVGWSQTRASDRLTMLAEALRDVGYETVGVSENPWISDSFNMTQGFEQFRSVVGFNLTTEVTGSSETLSAVKEWLASRKSRRPFFLFVNLLDAHFPYVVRDENPFLPDVEPSLALRLARLSTQYFCRDVIEPGTQEVRWGLYLGGVSAADGKVGGIRDALVAAGLGDDLITIVTSDHGEHFGEHRLVGHLASLREPLLRVPLVVHNPRGTRGVVIAEPVPLIAVFPTILEFAGVRPPPGRASSLPVTRGAVTASRPMIAELDDSSSGEYSEDSELARGLRQSNMAARRDCTDDNRVFGGMRSIIRGPWKVISYDNYAPELFNLDRDPGERTDLSAVYPEIVSTLRSELAEKAPAADADRLGAQGGVKRFVDPEIKRRLEGLGYAAE